MSTTTRFQTNIALPADPTSPLEATTKQYVDAGLNTRAPVNDAALTGNPTAPTQAVGNNSTRLATTAFTVAEIGSRAPTKAGVGATGTWGIGITGNAATATRLTTARAITLGGVLGGTANFDGSANITLSATIADAALSIAKTSGLQAALDARAPSAHTHSEYLQNNIASPMLGAGIVNQNIILSLANPGIGYSNGFNFVRGSDQAGLYVQEYANDATVYEFRMADNPDGTSDMFSWVVRDHQGINGVYQPLRIRDLTIRMIGKGLELFAPILQTTGPFYTTGDNARSDILQYMNHINDRTRLPITVAGAIEITEFNVANYNSTTGRVFFIRAVSATTYGWGYGSQANGTFQETDIPFSTALVTLGNGVRVRFSAATGAAVNDRWQCRIFVNPVNTLSDTTVNGQFTAMGAVSLPANSINIENTSGLQTELDTRARLGNIGSGDFNNATTAGIYRYTTGNANNPGGNNSNVLVMRGTSSDTLAQVAIDYQANILRFRTASGVTANPATSNWRDWKSIFHEGNLPTTAITWTATQTFDDGSATPMVLSRTNAAQSNLNIQFTLNGMTRFVGFDSAGVLKVGASAALNSSGVAVAMSNTLVNAGNGLTGGGSLASDRTVALGTPGTITPTSTNAVQATSHTHELSAAVFTNNLVALDNVAQPLPSFWSDGSTAGSIKTSSNTGGVAGDGFPGTMGATWTFRMGIGESASTYGRAFELHKPHIGSNDDVYVRGYNSNGTTRPFRKLWHEGNLDYAALLLSIDGKLTSTPNLLAWNAIPAIDIAELTNIGRSTNTSTRVTRLNSAQAWADLPIGFSSFVNGDVGTANGAPTETHGYFTKLSTRDTSRGWTGLWMDHGTARMRLGYAASSDVMPTWTALMSSTWTLTAGNGLTGGGNGDANRTVSLGTPGVLTSDSTSAVQAESHTHAIQLEHLWVQDDRTTPVRTTPDTYRLRALSAAFNTGANVGMPGTFWGTLTLAQWNTYNVAHRQMQMLFPGDGHGLYFRRAAAADAWDTPLRVLTFEDHATVLGENILLNSSFDDETARSGWTIGQNVGNNGTFVSIAPMNTIGRGRALRMEVTWGAGAANRYFEISQTRFNLLPGATYTASGEMRAGGDALTAALIVQARSALGAFETATHTTIATDGVQRRPTASRALTALQNGMRTLLRLNIPATAGSAWLEVDDVVLQAGTIATDWLPAIADAQQNVRRFGVSDSDGVVRSPAGAAAYFGASTTGAIKIKLPGTFSSNAMSRFRISLFTYGPNRTAVDFIVGGYIYAGTGAGGYWVNQTVSISTASSDLSSLTVRFGSEDGQPVVYIGELTTVWPYTHVEVSDFQAIVLGAATTLVDYERDWSVGMENTAFGPSPNGQTHTATPQIPATHLATTRTLALSGPVTGSATFNGSANATIAATVNVGHASVTGILPGTRGGTGLGAFTTGSYLRALSSTTLEMRTPAQVLTDIGAVSPDTAMIDRGMASNAIDWNTLVAPGVYRVGAAAWTGSNQPTSAAPFGTLVVVASGQSVTQIYYPHATAAPTPWHRTKWNAADWNDWVHTWHSGILSLDVNATNGTVVQRDGGGQTLAINYRVPAGDGRGLRFWDSDSYKIYMTPAGSASWGGRIAGDLNSDHNMHFRMAGGGTNRGFYFEGNGGAKLVGIHPSGVRSSVAITAPELIGAVDASNLTGTVATARLASDVIGEANFISNGDFSDGTAYWSNSGSPTTHSYDSTVDSGDGNGSLRFTDGLRIVNNQAIPVKKGEVWIVRFDVLTNAVVTGSPEARVGLVTTPGSATWIAGMSAGSFIGTGALTWTTREYRFTPAIDTIGYLRFGVSSLSGGSATEAWIDNVRIFRQGTLADVGVQQLQIGELTTAVGAVASNVLNKVDRAGDSMSGKLTLPAPVAAAASLNLPHGVAPTSLVNGDMWTTTANAFVRLNGTTRTLAHTASWSVPTQAEVEAGTVTTARLWTAERDRQGVAAYAPAKSGLGATGMWDISITGGASALSTARLINGVAFDGTSDITIPSSSMTLTFGNGFGNGSFNGATNQTLTLGTPGTITNSTTNSVTATSHTHALTVTKADVGLSDVPNLDFQAFGLGTNTQLHSIDGAATPYDSRFGTSLAGARFFYHSAGASPPDSPTGTQTAGLHMGTPWGRAQIALPNNGDMYYRTGTLTTWKQVVDTGRSVVAGNGLSGGGTFAADRTITLGTPGTLSGSTTNSVTASSHTHELSPTLTAWDAILPATKLDATANAASATILVTARTINGTSFNGSANITTANWGTARTITIGGAGKSINGSANVSWTAAELVGGQGLGNTAIGFQHAYTTPVAPTAPGTNSNGIMAGNGDACSATVNNLRLFSWFGIGLSPSISGQAVPQWEYSHFFNTRNGNMNWRGVATGNGSGITNVAAEKLATARTINGVAFDGTANITISSTPRANLGPQAQTITDWNNATDNGWYMAVNATNAPAGDTNWYIGQVTVHNGDWIQQEIFQFTASNPKRYRRQKNGGTWGGWTDAQVVGRLDVERSVVANSSAFKDVGVASAYFARGAKYTQFGGLALLWDDARIWQIGAESNGDFKLWSYSESGVYQGNPITVKGDGRVGLNIEAGADHFSALNVGGGIRSRGAAATVGFTARDDGRLFDWYATGNRARLYADGVGDLFTVGTGKEMNVTTTHYNGGDPNPLRMIYGAYGAFFRQDGGDLYLMVTNPGDQYGGWSGLRPMRWNLATGNVFTDHRFDAAGGLFGGRIATGYDSGVGGSVSASNWFRSSGDTGWYNATYAGGMWMTDSTYVRAYNGTQIAAADFVISSDIRLKEDITPFKFNGRLRPVHFKMRETGEWDFGFIADDVAAFYPQAVGVIQKVGGLLDGQMIKQLSYQKLTAVLSFQINRVEDEVVTLKKRVKQLERIVATQDERLRRLEEESMWAAVNC